MLYSCSLRGRCSLVYLRPSIVNRTVGQLGGKPDEMLNWRNRILVPYAIAIVSKTAGIKQSQAYLLVRWASGSFALACFALLVTRATGTSYWIGSAAALLHEITLLPTFFHIYEIPSDFTDSAIFSLLILAALRGRRYAFTLLIFIGALNRESAVFGVVVWWFLHALGQRDRKNFFKESAWCFGWGLACAVFVFLVRAANSPIGGHARSSVLENFAYPRHFTEQNLHEVWMFISHPNYSNSYFYLAAYVLVMALLLCNEWPLVPSWARRLTIAAALIFLISSPTNHIAELRMYIPSLVLCNLVIVTVAISKLNLVNRRAVSSGD
jgi:hypothetical protein